MISDLFIHERLMSTRATISNCSIICKKKSWYCFVSIRFLFPLGWCWLRLFKQWRLQINELTSFVVWFICIWMPDNSVGGGGGTSVIVGIVLLAFWSKDALKKKFSSGEWRWSCSSKKKKHNKKRRSSGTIEWKSTKMSMSWTNECLFLSSIDEWFLFETIGFHPEQIFIYHLTSIIFKRYFPSRRELAFWRRLSSVHLIDWQTWRKRPLFDERISPPHPPPSIVFTWFRNLLWTILLSPTDFISLIVNQRK